MNKFGFIKQLLDNEKFKPSQKERFLKLVSKELESSEDIDNKVLEEIEKIKVFIESFKKDVESEKSDKPDTDKAGCSLPEYLNPKHLHEFLLEYNQNPILKYTCHPVDNEDNFIEILNVCGTQEYDYHKHVKSIHKNYSTLSFKYKDKILKNISGLISRYLGSYEISEGWSENIKIKWTSDELKTWCDSNPGKVPNPGDGFNQNIRFSFQTIELKSGDSLSHFTGLVKYFKHLFHIKHDNPLRPFIDDAIFLEFNNEVEYDFEFDNDFSYTIDLFTYVETLMQALIRIIKLSKNHYEEERLNVKLYFGYDEFNQKEFKIVILNSKQFGKNFCDFRLGDSLTSLIKYQVNGLCDLYLKAFFNDKNSVGIVNVWNGHNMEFIESEEAIEGVEFILKMY